MQAALDSICGMVDMAVEQSSEDQGLCQEDVPQSWSPASQFTSATMRPEGGHSPGQQEDGR